MSGNNSLFDDYYNQQQPVVDIYGINCEFLESSDEFMDIMEEIGSSGDVYAASAQEKANWIVNDPRCYECYSTYLEPESYHALERERFDGFSFLSIPDQLDFLADALLKFPSESTFKLFTLFALMNHNRGFNKLFLFI